MGFYFVQLSFKFFIYALKYAVIPVPTSSPFGSRGSIEVEVLKVFEDGGIGKGRCRLVDDRSRRVQPVLR